MRKLIIPQNAEEEEEVMRRVIRRSLSGAASRLLELFFGRDDIPFVLTSVNSLEATRLYRGFSEAASEAADSRMYAGLHFEFSTNAGLSKGRSIAEYVWRHGMRPTSEEQA